MEIVLLVVTLVALALAVGMSVLAWRLMRHDRQRSEARADALRTMAMSDQIAELEHVVEPWPSIRSGHPEPVEAWDWRLRVPGSPLQPSASAWGPQRVEEHASSPARDAPSFEPGAPPMFGATLEHHGPQTRRLLALATVAVVMASLAGTVYTVLAPGSAGAPPVASETVGSNPAVRINTGAARPIELLSLRHSTGPDGTFTVTGLVQNPFDGRVVRHVEAVVSLYDRDGHYLASGKAALDFTALPPGDESPFVVHVPNAGRVSRYRVGFRSDEGGVVVHIDRRSEVPGGATGDAIDRRPMVTPAASSRRSEG